MLALLLACGTPEETGAQPVESAVDSSPTLDSERPEDPCVDLFLGATPWSCEGTEDSLDCDGDGVPDECQTSTCVSEHPQAWYRYEPGTLPIVLSSPHGGDLLPEGMDLREGASTGKDSRTQELTYAVSDALFERTGHRPHVVVMNLHRWVVEANSWELEDATGGQDEAEAAYNEYHRWIEAATARVETLYGGGLYIDMHGLASSRTHIELGYLIDGSRLDVSDARLDLPGVGAMSSLRSLSPDAALFRGDASLGGLLEAAGYPVVPSPSLPAPTGAYFEGGYSTARHGSRQSGQVAGLQIEHTWAGVRDSDSARRAYADALAASLESWMDGQGLSLAPSVVSFDRDQELLWEGGSPLTVTVFRHGDVEKALTVPLTATGADGVVVPNAIGFAAGESSKDITLVPIDDKGMQGPRTVVLSLERAAEFNVGTDTLTIRLADDDVPSAWIEGVEGDTLLLRRDSCLEPMTVSVEVDGQSSEVSFEDATATLVTQPEGAGLTPMTATLGTQQFDWLAADPDQDADLLFWLGESPLDRARNATVLRGTTRPLEDGGWGFDGDTDALVWEGQGPTGSYSLAFSFKADPARAESYSYLFSHGGYWWSGALNIYLTPNGTLRTVPTGHDQDEDLDALDVVQDFYDDAWHRVLLTVDEGENEATVWVDEVLRTTAARGSGGTFQAGMVSLVGGRHDLHPDTHFLGELDRVCMWSRVVTVSEADGC